MKIPTIPTWLILISVLTILVCVIAYVSDNMGKKLGKKRISLFGLRPRQTATALTMATSVGIMLVTLAVGDAVQQAGAARLSPS
jgi:uncharacterized protein (DUF3084 family)